MSGPYIPAVLAAPVYNPAVGSTGNPPLPYVSNSEFQFAPTALTGKDLKPGANPAQDARALADALLRASSWADEIAFGADAAGDNASLAATLSVESAYVPVRQGEVRLICDYRPIVQVVGIDMGADPSTLASIGSLSSLVRVGRRTIYVPYLGLPMVGRNATMPGYGPLAALNRVYAVWSYVTGYAHMSLNTSVVAGATSCVVNATDGNGGVWGVLPASGTFPGTALTVWDGANTERVFVKSITTDATNATTTLTTSPFANAHNVPAAPDFVPLSAIPASVHQAVITLAMCLIKTRGSRALVMPNTSGGRPTRQAIGQAGMLEDYDVAVAILHDFGVRMKRS